MASDIRWRLRDATQADHQRLEGRLDIFSRIATAGGRCDLVRRFYGLHAGAEAALAPDLEPLEGLDFASRRRTLRLRADLDALEAEAPAAVALDAAGGAAWALGVLYVLEGSTLGGKVIGRQVAAQGGDMTGLSFLDPYGERGPERWRSFLEVLDRETVSQAAAQAAVAGALSGFRHAERVLCEAAAALS